MSLEALEALVIGFLSTMPGAKTPETVRRVLNGHLAMRDDLAGTLSAAQIEAVARQIEAKLVIDMADAASIQLPFEDWLPGRRATTTHFYYPRYRKFIGLKGFSPAVLGVLDKDTDKIVGLLENPQRPGAWKRRGLVV